MIRKKVEKPWYKRWWVIILFIFVGLIILRGLFGGDSPNPSNIVSLEKSCKSLIPDRIKLGTFYIENDGQYYSNRDSYLKELITEPYLWNDGTPIIDEYGTISFKRGSREGENTNLIYSTPPMKYSKTPVDEDGTIGKEVSYWIMLVLNPEDKNDDGYKVEQYKCCEDICNIVNKNYQPF